jgi:hypothetical protein
VAHTIRWASSTNAGATRARSLGRILAQFAASCHTRSISCRSVRRRPHGVLPCTRSIPKVAVSSRVIPFPVSPVGDKCCAVSSSLPLHDAVAPWLRRHRDLIAAAGLWALARGVSLPADHVVLWAMAASTPPATRCRNSAPPSSFSARTTVFARPPPGRPNRRRRRASRRWLSVAWAEHPVHDRHPPGEVGVGRGGQAVGG